MSHVLYAITRTNVYCDMDAKECATDKFEWN